MKKAAIVCILILCLTLSACGAKVPEKTADGALLVALNKQASLGSICFSTQLFSQRAGQIRPVNSGKSLVSFNIL